MAKGKFSRRGKFCEFCEALERANAEAQLALAKLIHDAARGGQPIKETRTVTRADGSIETTVTEKTAAPDWRAAALMLERRFPAQWGRKDAVKVEVDWRQELQQIGVDPDAIVNQTVELLRGLRADDASHPLGSGEAIEI
jgi:hypothetical protein